MKDVALQDRPREKLARVGAEGLGENELVAILLGTGMRSRSALLVAQDLLTRVGGVKGLARVTVEDLVAIPGLGMSRAARLVAAFELGRRAIAARVDDRPVFKSSHDVAGYLLPLYGAHRVERFGVLMLDAKRRLVRTAIVSVGSVDASIVHPREIFREAAVASAAGVVVFHNHPSGDPSPSVDDFAVTKRLVDAGRLMGIDVLDHLILGHGRYYSFRDSKTL